MHFTRKSATMRASGVVAAVAVAALALSGCTASGDSGGKTVITLAGPNQWNTESSTFGKEWEALIAAFEKKEPNIEVKTTVLPLSSFADTLATQLTAGTAPELIFNQVAHQPDQVVSLDKYLAEPNPYDPDAKTWKDVFNPNAFNDAQRNAANHFEWVPFNLVTTGVFYNKELIEKAKVKTPIENIGDLVQACTALKKIGVTPLAMDSGTLGTGWTAETMMNNLLAKYGDKWNVYDASGNPGTAPTVTNKSMARAILTGELDATKLPEVAETLDLLKKVFENCATPNWSGVASSATFVGGEEFLGGKAAMAWGTNFAISNFDQVKWGWSSMPYPTVAKSDTSLATGDAARFGAVAGGTSYMIPATTKGAKLDAAIKFLQFATSPQGNGDWVKATNAIPATKDVSTASAGLTDLLSGDWAKPPIVSGGSQRPQADTNVNIWEGYLLGTKSKSDELQYLQSEWTAWAKEIVQQGGSPRGRLAPIQAERA
jgi:ABC-type glycerol-3-phosphate transport system substrate-binding protein